MPECSISCALNIEKAERITRSAGCSQASPLLSTKVTPVARFPDLSVLILTTSELSRAVKLDLRTSTGRIVVCGLAFE